MGEAPQRDDEAWQKWLRENSGKWLFYARQQTRSAADAEDVLQDALIKTWKTCGGLIEPETTSLVYTNIRRCAIDRARSSLRRAEREQTVAEESPQIEEALFDVEGDQAAFAQSIQKALAKIPEKYREVIVLKIWGDLTFAQIAEQLSEKPNTVASRYRYGLDNLRRILGAQGDELLK